MSADEGSLVHANALVWKPSVVSLKSETQILPSPQSGEMFIDMLSKRTASLHRSEMCFRGPTFRSSLETSFYVAHGTS